MSCKLCFAKKKKYFTISNSFRNEFITLRGVTVSWSTNKKQGGNRRDFETVMTMLDIVVVVPLLLLKNIERRSTRRHARIATVENTIDVTQQKLSLITTPY